MGPDLLADLPAAWTVLSRGPAGFITDFDGTISPIVDRPERAKVHPRVPGLLARLARQMELVAVVSGRPIRDLLDMVEVDTVLYVGNHGLEWWEAGRSAVAPEARPYLPQMAATMRCLQERIQLSGVIVEDKGPTGSVHYRIAADPTTARQTILRAIEQCPSAKELEVAEGRKVVNLLPPVQVDKGTAVERLIHLHGLGGAIYLGDDVTDVDAFRKLRSLRRSGVCNGLAVAVVSEEAPPDLASEADFVLRGIDAVVSFMEQTARWLEDRTGDSPLAT